MIAASSVQKTFSMRPAQASEATQLLRFVLALAFESEQKLLEPFIAGKGIQQVFEDPTLGQYWVLEDPNTNQPIGMCLVTPEWSDWNNQFYWWLQSIYLDPLYRGQGLLEQMIEHLDTSAREAEVSSVRLYVDSQNVRAIKAYNKAGFQPGNYHLLEKRLG